MTRRWVVVLALLALLVGGGVVERAVEPEPTRVRALPGAQGPTAPDPDALSSSWYCPGGSAAGNGAAEVSVAIANPGDRPAEGNLTVYGPEGVVGTQPISVDPGAGTVVALSSVGRAPWAAALVDLVGGGAVVEQRVAGPQGDDAGPCSVTASRQWYFAAGSTARDATLTVHLFNPFPEDAIADMVFATGEGRREPADFAGIVVPGRTVRVVDIGSHVRRQDVVSTAVSLRAGRVVAGAVQVRTAAPHAGVSAAVGAPALGTSWHFADGLAADGVVERFELFNPTRTEAQVEVELSLDEGEAEPFELLVPAEGRVTLVVNGETRVPKGVAHAAVVRSVNDVPFVVQRTLEATAPRAGRADTLGARSPARRWAFAVGGPTDALDHWVVVHNTSARPATVSLTGLAAGQRLAIEGVQGVVIPAGRRQAFRLSDHVKREHLPVVVESDQPVVAERALYAVGRPGLSSSLGVPLG